MTQRSASGAMSAALLAVAATLLAACGGDNLSIGPTPTVTSTTTRTATHTPTSGNPTATSSLRTPTPTAVVSAAVAGIILVNQNVAGGADDGLMELPPESLPPAGKGFDRGLGNADWVVDGGVAQGTTTDEGRFSISGLTPGRHVITVTKTVEGNLMELSLPIIVGDDGSAEVIAEVSWGLVRTTSSYSEGGAAMIAVFAPNGSHLITRDGRAVELGDYSRTLVDADGDGSFDPQTGNCEEIYRCDAEGGCGDPERVCVCIPSCPDCQDCPTQACVSRTYFHEPECGPDGLCKALPYACEGQDGCQPGEQCTCIASCFGCDNCKGSACVQPCQPGEPVDIVRIDAYGPSRVMIGQEGNANASAVLSDGTAVDVTWLATWASSQPSVATVDGWGRIAALAVGATDITAAVAEVTSPALALTVVERPTLLRITVQNASCYFYPLPDDGPAPPSMESFLPPPSCQQVVRIGGEIHFTAIGEFDTGYYEDITDEVEWRVEPAAVGDVVNGLFTGRQAGVATLTAALAGVVSDASEIRVVTEPTIVALSVYPSDWGYQYIDGGPLRGAADQPCFECGYLLTLLRGDTVHFSATAHYDTGEWEDVSGQVTWRSSSAAVASIDAGGVLTAEGAGDAAIDATLNEITSGAVSVHVVNEATLQSLYIYQDGQSLAIGKGEEAVFHASGYYDVGFDRDVTQTATWHSSDDAVGGFDSPGVFTGRSAGNVTVWAELDGQQSAPLDFEVYATSELDFCDAANVNRGTWSDDFNRVTLESDCADYTQPDVVELRFSVTETQRPGGLFNPCLDLYAFSGDTMIRTIREEGCGDPFLAPGAPGRDEAELKYQLSAFWDLKDASGTPVPPGAYTVRGVFYLYYDPVVQIEVRVNEPTPAP